MPSPDDTHFNIRRLHLIFAVSSLALLAVTVWMLVDDHYRQWKVYQRTYRDSIEPWLTEARIRSEKSEAYRAKEEELLAMLEGARATVPDRRLIDRFCKQVERGAAARKTDGVDLDRLRSAFDVLSGEPSIDARRQLLRALGKPIAAADLRRENIERRLRFRRADFDEARTGLEAAVGEGISQAKLDKLQRRVGRIKREVDELASLSEDASAHLEELMDGFARITRPETAAAEALAQHRAELERLDRTLALQRPGIARRLLRLPIIDAFGRPLSVDQIWLPELTIDYNFRQVARFDRCTTCHQAIGQTKPGAARQPSCMSEEVLTVQLPVPDVDEEDGVVRLRNMLGLVLAGRGILDPQAPTVGLVLTKTPAADARLMVGDVILKVNDQPVGNRTEAVEQLLAASSSESRESDQNDEEAGEDEDEEQTASRSIRLEIRRGLPHPFQSHPRLELFVGTLSPHPMAEFGCTICHDGQGSATEFKYASHSPNDPAQRDRWREQYGWFWNHHWDFPMLPGRFTQSRCLKCHHEVTDLEPSERFPEEPAPKLLAGYHLIRQNGCFGCHEIKGVAASGDRTGPDLRLEPNYTEAALQLLAHADLTDEQKALATQVISSPDDAGPRRRLVESIRAGGIDTLDPGLPAMVELLAAEAATPGTIRKVGPSLRDVAGRLDRTFLESWIGRPSDFRPETRMPRFYAMHEHLDGRSLEDARRFEAVEIHAISEYLLSVGQSTGLAAAAGVTEPASADRGKRLFQVQGCLACHKHADFPESQATQGPDLSRLGSKLSTDAGAAWLAGWIRDPARHAPRTLMPNPLLEPVRLPGGGDAAGVAEEKSTDPAVDIAEYLLASTGWKAKELRPPLEADLADLDKLADLDELALLHLSKTFPQKTARRYLKQGIPKIIAKTLQGDAIELSGGLSTRNKLRYVGRRTISKRGCYGCHDIPGFEAAQPIGPELSDWGRKQESLLAFEQVHQLLAESPGSRHDGSTAEKSENNPDRAFYMRALRAHRREGFIWQKLRAPRSFDYKKADNKGYNERLTMGRFSLTDDQREAIATFVLGLVAQPPSAKYVYHGDARHKAIVEGRKVLDKYACAECHTLDMERWTFEFDPDEFEVLEPAEDFPFLAPHFTTRQIEDSTKTDRRGLARAEVVGMPQVDQQGEPIEIEGDEEDEQGEPLPMYSFSLWEPAVIGGRVCTVGGADVLIYKHQITKRRPQLGGTFARLLYPVALAAAKAAGANVAGMEAWGWGPPPLVHEGEMAQPAWLHDYLLDPRPIRPAAVLRMPKYNMSSEEAGKLVDYFAARSRVDFPYSSRPPSRTTDLATGQQKRPHRLDEAMRVLIDRNTYCAKCHLIDDFSPGGETITVLAPNLAEVDRRLRPEYVRRWLAHPKAVRPYTGMPVNFPPTGEPLGQNLLPGSSLEQLDAMVDLLRDYDHYIRRRTSIRKMIESAKEPKSSTLRKTPTATKRN